MKGKTIEEKKTNIDRYYMFILLNLGLKGFLQDIETNFRFVGTEIDFDREDGGELRPDIILQYEDSSKTNGFPIEAKLSLSGDESVKTEIEKLERYDQELTEWDTEDGKVDDHFIVFMPNLEDSSQVERVYKEKTDLELDREFHLWEWYMGSSTKFGEGDNLLLRSKMGNLEIEDRFVELLNEGIRMDFEEAETLYEKERTLFTRQRPPVEWTIVMLWQTVCRGMEDYFTIEDVQEEIHSKFTTQLMDNVDGNSFTVRKDWIEDALDNMVDLDLAEKVENDDEADEYSILFSKQIEKNFKDYVCEGLGIEEEEDQQTL